MSARRVVRRLLALVQARRLDRELDDEIAAHLELAERDALARGLSLEAARADARRALGPLPQLRERHRDARSLRWLEHAALDIRRGVTGLGRDPLFTAVAVGVVALGIGANTAMFSVVDALLFRPLPFPQPERIVRLWETPTPTTANSTTTRTFVEIAAQNRSFEAISAESPSTATLLIDGEPVRLTGRYVSAGHFRVFGVAPVLGRDFRDDEDRAGADRVLILSHAAWHRHFGADPGVLERDLTLDGVPHRVIGVLPPGPFDRQRRRPLEEPASFWRLNAFDPDELATAVHWLDPVARLKPGVSLEQAQQDVLAVRARIAELVPAWKREWSVLVEPFDRILVGERLRQAVFVALGAVVLVLLIACANLAALLLSRGAARRQEIAVRAALGASRARIASHLLAETTALALAGGLAGVALAAALLRVAVPLLPPLPFTADVTLDLRVLAFAAAAALAVAALVGTLPALRLSAAPAAAALADASRGSSGAHQRTRRALVAAEVAISVVLLCGAGLLVTSLLRLQAVDVGARLDRVVTMSLDLPRDRYPSGLHLAAFYRQLTARLHAIPGLERASISGDVPLEGTGGEYLRMPGGEDRLLTRFKRADEAYFDTLGIPVRAGRGFSAEDRSGAPLVVVVNEVLARRLAERFGVADPVGRGVELPALGFGRDRRAVMSVVGIVGNERVQSDLRAPADPVAYVPIAQAPRLQVKLSVRASGDAVAAVPAIRAAVRTLDPRLALADVRTMEDIRAGSLSGMREPVWAVGAFAAVAALLAAFGLYGIVAHTVTQRRREIGIRVALGASAGDVLAMVTRGTIGTVALGLAAGMAGAVALARVIRSLLFEVSPLDPAALGFGALAMTACALLAAVVPARRALRVDPAAALRREA